MKPAEWIDAVMADTRLSLEARGLLVILGRNAADAQNLRTEAQRLVGCSKGRLDRMMRELRDLGWVATTPRAKGGRALVVNDAPGLAPEGSKTSHSDGGEGQSRRVENQPFGDVPNGRKANHSEPGSEPARMVDFRPFHIETLGKRESLGSFPSHGSDEPQGFLPECAGAALPCHSARNLPSNACREERDSNLRLGLESDHASHPSQGVGAPSSARDAHARQATVLQFPANRRAS